MKGKKEFIFIIIKETIKNICYNKIYKQGVVFYEKN